MPNLQGSETAFLDQVVALAHVCGWLIHHDRPARDRRGHWASHIQGDPGFCDLVLAKGGRILFVELKVGRGKLTPAQEAWMDVLNNVDFPGFCGVWRPDDWDCIVATLKGERDVPA